MCDYNHKKGDIMLNIIDVYNDNRFVVKEYQKDEILFHENEICKNIGIVISGSIKIVSYSFSGKEIVYSVIEKNQMFGNNLIFSSTPVYKGNIIANSNVKIALLNKINLLDLLTNNIEFLNKYLNILSDNAKKLNDINKLLLFDKAEERLLYYLFINKGEINYKSITALALTLYLRRESLSRTISLLKKNNKIKVLGNKIKLI